MMRVYLRENVPQNLHYKNSWRLAPVLLFAAPGWLIAETDEDVISYSKLILCLCFVYILVATARLHLKVI